MALPGADPAAALKQIQQELQEKFDESGMAKVEEFTDSLDDIMDKVKSGPQQVMNEAKAKFEEFKGSIEAALKDPASLAPGGGAMAGCATMYGNSVAGKLGSLTDETATIVKNITDVAAAMEAPLKSIGDTLESVMAELEGSLKALAKLPKVVGEAIKGKDSPDDIAQIETGPMKKALECGDIDTPLGKIKGLKEVLGDAATAVEKAIAALADFIERAPGMVRGAFDAPPPLCFLTSILLSQAPKAMTDLLALVDKLKQVKLQPVIDIFSKTTETIGNLDVDQVKNPMNKFIESAKGLVEKLDNTVKGAALASNPAGALGSMAPPGVTI